MNSIISWVGGKKALRDLIYLRMPKNYDRYIEVFGGGGWVLFGKPPDKCMEVYNDFNSNLANLFYCVKERPMALLRELSFLPLNSRDEFTTLRKFLAMEEFKSEHLAEELEIATHLLKEPEAAEIRDILMERAAVGDVKRAAAFYKIIRYSYGSGCTSYGCQPFDIRKTFTIIWEANRRLKDTVIENKDFEALIRQYDRPNAFFYCDPPYFETEGHYGESGPAGSGSLSKCSGKTYESCKTGGACGKDSEIRTAGGRYGLLRNKYRAFEIKDNQVSQTLVDGNLCSIAEFIRHCDEGSIITLHTMEGEPFLIGLSKMFVFCGDKAFLDRQLIPYLRSMGG